MAVHADAVEAIAETSGAERVVADVWAIGAPALDAERVRDSVPLWFHTFALAPGIYTPGIARHHGYRLVVLGADRFARRSVLDVSALTASTAFSRRPGVRAGLSRVTVQVAVGWLGAGGLWDQGSRAARRVSASRACRPCLRAVDDEQYVDWVRARFGVTLEGGAGFLAIAGLAGFRVEYRRMDAVDVNELGERFDLVLCFGLLHRVTDPIGLLRALVDVLDRGGEICLRPMARVCALTRLRSRFTSGATCTRAMTLSTGASRRRVCGDWRGSLALTRSRRSTSWRSLAIRGSSRCCERPANRALRSWVAFAAQAACDVGDRATECAHRPDAVRSPRWAGWRFARVSSSELITGVQGSIACERPTLNAVCSGRVSLDASARASVVANGTGRRRGIGPMRPRTGPIRIFGVSFT